MHICVCVVQMGNTHIQKSFPKTKKNSTHDNSSNNNNNNVKQPHSHWFNEGETSSTICSHTRMDQALPLLSEPFLLFPVDLTEQPSRAQHNRDIPQSTELKRGWAGNSLVLVRCRLSLEPLCNVVRVSGDQRQGLAVAVTWPRGETSSRRMKNNPLWLKLWKERV